MLLCDSVVNVGHVTLHGLGWDLNSEMFQPARAGRVVPLGVELEPDKAMEKPVSGGPETFTGPEEELLARKGALDWGVEEPKTERLPGKRAENFRRILSHHLGAFRRARFGEPCKGGAGDRQPRA